MKVRKNQAVSGALLSLATLWIVAIPFGLLVEAHYNGPFAAPPDSVYASRFNMLAFQARDVFFSSVFCSVLLVVHWSLLLWRKEPLRSQKVANFMLMFAFFVLSLLWLDSLLDEYYRFSLFCIGGGKPVFALDIGWQCKSAYYAREIALPCTLVGSIGISFVLRLLPAKSPSSDDDV